MRGDFMFFGAPLLPFSVIPAQANCPYDVSTQRFVCPSVTRSGITTSLYYQLLDASNQPQSAFSPTTTAAIRTVNDVSGTLTTSGTTVSGSAPGTLIITGHGDHTLSGLLTDTHVLNGSSTTTLDIDLKFNDLPVNDTFTLAETTTNLVLPKRGSSSPYPQSGSIALDLTSAADHTLDSHVVITFDGTNVATIVSTENGMTQTCRVDLTGKTEPQCSG
jgi:hypothetical protein